MKTKIHFIYLLLLLAGCANTASVWQKTQKSDTIGAYQEFLLEYPQNEFTLEANRRIAQLSWAAVQSSNTIEAYQEFLRQYPQHEFSVKANRRIEQLRWEATQNSNTIEAYQEFLQSYAQSEHSGEIRAKLEALHWTRATESDTKASYNSFLSSYPLSKNRDAAVACLSILEREAFERSAKAGRLESVKNNINAATADQKSRALMMALWGALHTTPMAQLKLDERGGIQKLDFYSKRTASVGRAVYVDILRLLIDSGADPEMYEYRHFDSVATKEHLLEKRLKESLTEDGIGYATTTLGSNSEVELVRAGAGESARWVAEIEGADDILALLSREK